MQNLFTKIRCVSWNKLFFSCCLVCISMTRALSCQSAVENKAGILACDATEKFVQSRYTGFRCHKEVCATPVYRRTTPQGSLRKAGIPASDVLGVKTNLMLFCCMLLTSVLLSWCLKQMTTIFLALITKSI